MKLPRLTPEQRRTSAILYDRANQVLGQKNYEYAIGLLLQCCEVDPGNLLYRKVLRQAERDKYENNGKGQALSFLTTLRGRIRLEAALGRGEYLQVLEIAEQILLRNPWHVRAQVGMAKAYEALGLLEHAIWVLEQILVVETQNAKLHKKAAELYEKRGLFTQAIAHWNQVRKINPSDVDASSKTKNLAASDTIAKGRYQEAVDGESAPVTAGVNETQGDEAVTKPEMAVDPGARFEREAGPLRAKILANPTNPNGYLHLAQYFRRQDQFDRARQVILDGLGPTGNNFHLSLELLDLEIEPLRRDLALAQREDAASGADLSAIRQKLAQEIHQRELAYYRQKSDRFSTDTNARFEMAIRLLRVGQVEEAIKEFQNLRGDARNLGKILFYLGFCFKTRNHWRLAQRNFEEALQHLPPGEDELRREAMYLLATGCAETGDLQRAIDVACELANLDFSYKNIGASIEQWQAKMQKR